MAKSEEIPDFGLLHGVKVLSTGTVAAEPCAATLMAEHGADVVQVENARSPEGMPEKRRFGMGAGCTVQAHHCS